MATVYVYKKRNIKPAKKTFFDDKEIDRRADIRAARIIENMFSQNELTRFRERVIDYIDSGYMSHKVECMRRICDELDRAWNTSKKIFPASRGDVWNGETWLRAGKPAPGLGEVP